MAATILTRLSKPSSSSLSHFRRFISSSSSSAAISSETTNPPSSPFTFNNTTTTLSRKDPKDRNVQWVFLGCPGVGKGTYASRLSSLLGVPHIATGDLVREELASSGPLSHQLTEIVNQGKLVSDEIIISLLSKRLEAGEAKGESGFILDGFPRTIRQAEILEGVTDIDLVVNLKLREDVLLEKCLGRRICSECGKNFNVASINVKGENGNPGMSMAPLLPPAHCMSKLVTRSDDTETVVTERLRIYNEKSQPVEEFYRSRRLALLEFKMKITHDPLQVMSSWNDSIHFCQWRGITCGRRHQRVILLDLQSLKLVGSISPHVGNLSFLRNLTLQNNSFHNEIPPQIGLLQRLQVLRLDNNTLSGKIPSNLSGSTNLRVLHVGYNLLTGEIPATLATLSKLQAFAIYNNNLTGSIPPPLGNLSFLELFSTVSNNLDGIIPDSLGQLTKLAYFTVADNMFSGTIPPSIFNLSLLKLFDIGVNQIQGSLPSDIGITLPHIRSLSISDNQFIGSIPVSISNATNLVSLQLTENKLTGEVPSIEKLNRITFFSITFNNLGIGGVNDLRFLCSLANATNLTVLAINVNNFGGELPKCIGNLSTTLSMMFLDNNKIFGKIPIEIGNLINLESLQMWSNKFSGNIPSQIGKLQKLQDLELHQNIFSGNIPSSLGNLSIVTNLYLFENNLQGSIPLSLSKCRNLIALGLNNNNLSGLINPQVIGLSISLIHLDFSSNRFTGVFPMEVGNLKNLEHLDISENMLFGKIPTSLGNCEMLQFLAMRRNHFQGRIPPSLRSLRGLDSLDLSDNNLSGQIPKFLEHFVFLKFLNLSYNHFEGELPTNGVFKNTSGTLVKGNDKLCGGIPKFHLPKCKYEKSKKRNLAHTLKLVVSIFSGLIGVSLVLSLLFFFSLRKKRKENTSSDSRNFLLNLSYQNLLNATDGFSSTNLIGAGSFGSVYKGILDESRHTIAVKVLNLSRHGASKSFKVECQALRNIRHRNLVKVITSCSGIDYQGHDFKALVMEYMGNGNVDEWLHPTPKTNETLEKPKNLSLLQRLNIAIDVANALDYLHHHCQTPIVHCDLKPSNVLLDDEMIGHVGDFGLARLLFDATRECSMDQSSSIGVRGTIGYAPPGKRPTNNIFQDGFNLHDYVKAALPEQVIDIVDPILLWEREEGETQMNDITSNECQIPSLKIQECMVLILEIGVACSIAFSRERMNMGAVIIGLHSIRKKLLGTDIHSQRLQATGAQ